MNKKFIKYALKNPNRGFISSLLFYNEIRKPILSLVDKSLVKNYPKLNRYNRPVKVQEDKAAMVSSMLHAIDNGLTQGMISKNVWKKFLKSFSSIYTYDERITESFKAKYGIEPPGFITISPSAVCNLKCTGCYANSSSEKHKKLSYITVSRIVREQKELWGSNFTVISGGEPLLWKDEDKTIFDLAKENSDTFFLMYTNGTLITPAVAKKMAEVGNITPAISVEGYEEETDNRRGKGVYMKIHEAFSNLKNAGVPFGISVTVTRDNVETIMSNEFFDYFINKQGALYCWMFQYMPIGRDINFDNMVTPEQRISLYKKTWELVRNKKMFIADFWNSGTTSNGCVSAGIHGGYIYIDWNGNIMPCVFNPYYTNNINDIYSHGGTLNNTLFSKLFEGIRKWQNQYAFCTSPDKMGNVITPCVIRDHFDTLYPILRESGAKGADEQAQQALDDENFRNCLFNYGKRMYDLSNGIWQQEYIVPEKERCNKCS
jgi:MoaA/NifB/PqqE/SkfB family radical SAM enzyme